MWQSSTAQPNTWEGALFEHDEEQVDDNNLMVCGYSSTSNFAENWWLLV